MRRRPEQGAEPPEPIWWTDKDQERPRLREKSAPTNFEPGTSEWWQEREDRPGDIIPDPDKK